MCRQPRTRRTSCESPIVSTGGAARAAGVSTWPARAPRRRRPHPAGLVLLGGGVRRLQMPTASGWLLGVDGGLCHRDPDGLLDHRPKPRMRLGTHPKRAAASSGPSLVLHLHGVRRHAQGLAVRLHCCYLRLKLFQLLCQLARARCECTPSSSIASCLPNRAALRPGERNPGAAACEVRVHNTGRPHDRAATRAAASPLCTEDNHLAPEDPCLRRWGPRGCHLAAQGPRCKRGADPRRHNR